MGMLVVMDIYTTITKVINQFPRLFGMTDQKQSEDC